MVQTKFLTLVKLILIFSLPMWAEQVLVSDGEFKNLALIWFKIITSTPELKLLNAGNLFKEILDRIVEKIHSKEQLDRLVRIYLVHHVTMRSMLNILGVHEVLVLQKIREIFSLLNHSFFVS